MRILLLSPYHAGSHEYWASGLRSYFAQHQWTMLTLPPRYFQWRMRGNGFIWSQRESEIFQQTFDLVLATSMTDLNSLYGFVPSLQGVPSILYFHENQFEYPQSKNSHANVEAQMVSFYASICANRLVFNSDYNLTSFFLGLNALMDKLPDFVPTGVIRSLTEKASVLPVPISHARVPYSLASKKDTPVILWNHRWEYDKWPECFFTALKILKRKGIRFLLNVIGQQFRTVPEIFIEAHEFFAQEILVWGWQQALQDYCQVLQNSDIVVSTSLHEFQGLAVQEAVVAGCIPVLPDRLVYPELYDRQYLYKSYPNDLQLQAQALAQHLERQIQMLDQTPLPKTNSWTWRELGPKYQGLFEEVCNR